MTSKCATGVDDADAGSKVVFDSTDISPGSMSRFVMDYIFHNSPTSLLAYCDKSVVERGAMAAAAIASGTVVAGWVSPARICLSGGRAVTLRKFNCHDPVTDSSYSAVVVDSVTRGACS
jgi:hypothetical protein